MLYPLGAGELRRRWAYPGQEIVLGDPESGLGLRAVQPRPAGVQLSEVDWSSRTEVIVAAQRGVDPYTYLVDVLPRVDSHPASDVAALTPRLWKEQFAAAPCGQQSTRLSTTPLADRLRPSRARCRSSSSGPEQGWTRPSQPRRRPEYASELAGAIIAGSRHSTASRPVRPPSSRTPKPSPHAARERGRTAPRRALAAPGH